MLVLIWAALLLTVTGSEQNDTTQGTENKPSYNHTVTNQRAEAGPVLQCLLTNDVKGFAWCKCQPSGVCNQQMINSGNNNNDLKKNCCITINNFTTSDAGIYQVKTETEKDCRTYIYEANITVKVIPRNSNGFAFKNQSDVQTLVCLSEGFSLPVITWPLLNSYEYTASTTVSVDSVISNMTVCLEYSSNITVNYISEKICSEIKENMCSSEDPKRPNKLQNQDDTNIFERLKKIFEDQLLFFLVFGVGILIGSLVGGFIACLAIQCCSRKKKSYSTEELELVTTETVPKFCDDGTLDLQDDGIQNHVAAELGEEPAVDLVDSDVSPKDMVYSDIDFSAIKEKNPTDAKEQGDATETEYAEIKRGEMDEAQENEGMDCEMLAGIDQTDVIIEHQVERKQGLLAEEVIGEDVPLCSNTNEGEN